MKPKASVLPMSYADPLVWFLKIMIFCFQNFVFYFICLKLGPFDFESPALPSELPCLSIIKTYVQQNVPPVLFYRRP